jgi:hypothetical protein
MVTDLESAVSGTLLHCSSHRACLVLHVFPRALPGQTLAEELQALRCFVRELAGRHRANTVIARRLGALDLISVGLQGTNYNWSRRARWLARFALGHRYCVLKVRWLQYCVSKAKGTPAHTQENCPGVVIAGAKRPRLIVYSGCSILYRRFS